MAACAWAADDLWTQEGANWREQRGERRSSNLDPDPDPTLSDAASFVMILAENIFSALKD